MNIALIYHYKERHLTTFLVEALEQHGYDVVLAPVHCALGSPAWQEQIRKDFEAASGFIVLMTENALNPDDNEWFLWRIHKALQAKPDFMHHKPIFPFPLLKDTRGTVQFFESFPSQQTDGLKRIFLMNLQLAECLILIHTDEEKLHDGAAQFLITIVEREIPHPGSCFVSYSHADQAFATRLVSDLRKCGHKVWVDKDSIRAGFEWEKEIERALAECTHVLLIASPDSVESANVADEIGVAINQGKPVIPLMIRECKLPMRVHRYQWIDFQEDYEEAFRKLHRNLINR